MRDGAPIPFTLVTETRMERYRAETFWTKEPETIAWIGSFQAGETFWDVGANIGIYSLFAAVLHPATCVHAFEPDRKNFRRLQENISRNAITNIAVYNIAVSDCNGLRPFGEVSDEIGSSGGQLGSGTRTHQQYEVHVRTLDKLAHLLTPPTHIKIDIDGQECAVVRGMRRLLVNPALRSVLIEIDLGNTDVRKHIHDLFAGEGFQTDNRFNTMTPHSRTRRAAEGIPVENVVFTRA